MIAFTFLCSLLARPAAVYEVVDVERHEVFAGRYGRRVTETLEVRADGRTYHVDIMGAYHTYFAGRQMPVLSPGDQVEIRGTLRGDTLRTDWFHIRKR